MVKLVTDCEWRTKPGPYDLDNAEYIWCVVFKELDRENVYKFTADNLQSMKQWLAGHDNLTIIGHNILGADLEIFRRMLGVGFTVGKDTIAGKECSFVDTLVMSRVLNPDREPVTTQVEERVAVGVKQQSVNEKVETVYETKLVNKTLSAHGLAGWGVRLGHGKPPVEDWEDQPIEVYLHRCEEDVRITEKVYNELMREIEK